MNDESAKPQTPVLLAVRETYKRADAFRLSGKRLKKKSYGSLNYKDWSKLDAEMKAKKYPAVHHSDVYNKANQPAYRILTLTEYKKLLATLI